MYYINRNINKFFSINITKKDLYFSNKNIIKELNNFDSYYELQSKYYPKDRRFDFLVINYFHFELSKITTSYKDKSIALAKLDFWNDTISEIYKDKLEIKDPLSIGICELKNKYKFKEIFFTSLINSKKKQIENNNNIQDYIKLVELGKDNYKNIIYAYLIILNINPNKEILSVIDNITTIYEVVSLIKKIPHDLNNNRFIFPENLKEKHDINLGNLWERLYGKPKEELLDAILELSAFGRDIFKDIIKSSNNLPPNTFRAFLRLVEFEYFFENLEKHNFDIFSKKVLKKSYFNIPIRFYRAAGKKQFFLHLN